MASAARSRPYVDAVFPIQKLVADGSYLSALAADTKTFLSMKNETPPSLLDRLARHAVLLEGASAVGWSNVETRSVQRDVADGRAVADRRLVERHR